jgi:hypothetical protein
MSAWAAWQEAWAAFGVLALEVSLATVAAVLLCRLIPSVFWRRTLWQACLIALLALVVLELGGGSPRLARRVFDEPVDHHAGDGTEALEKDARPQVPVPSHAPVRPSVLIPAPETPAPVRRRIDPWAERPVSAASPRAVSTHSRSPRFLDGCALIWSIGTTGILAAMIVARLRFRLLRRRCRTVDDASLRERTASLARRLGLHRRVRLLESGRFSGPVAFGLMRPAIGLPTTFARDHTAEQQDVMLAHELVHLASNDPAWCLLADVTAALLWWHPLVWWSRRRLRSASEAAADDASLLVPQGPVVLAECLVRLGARLRSPQPSGWLGIKGSGFRSGLARRVERLLNLRAPSWRPPGCLASMAARTLGPLTLVPAVVLCTAWTVPESSNNGEAMKTAFWKRSLAALALVPMLGAEPNRSLAAEPLSPPPSPAKPAAKAPALKAKLETITLNEVAYDSLPLGAVVDHLIKEAASRDPEKVGINFLFAQPTESPAIDPATGLPVAGSTSDVDLTATTIRIVPPLKKVRLVDVLDAIVRVADRPIKYSVEDYAVVFTTDAARAALAPPPHSSAGATVLRTYRLDYSALAASVQNMFGRKLQPGSANVAAELRENILPRFGVKLSGSNAEVFYNEVSGTLLIRGTPEDQAAVQPVIEMLGGGAPAAGGASSARPNTTPGGRGWGGGGSAGSASVARPATTQDDRPFVVFVGKTAPYFRLGDEPMTFPQLQHSLAEAAKNKPDLRLAIKVDRGAPFERLMKLIEAAQQAKINSVALVTEEQSAQ